MKGRFLCFVLVLQIVSLVSVAKRPFPPADDGMSHPGNTKESQAPYTIDTEKGGMVREIGRSEMIMEEMRKIGSSPPSCERKCYGCTPCEAIQVPSKGSKSSRHTHHLGIQYANYEPESWKCKCGPYFYSP